MTIPLMSPCATVDDLKLWLGEDEVIQLSDLCDPLNATLDLDKLQQALDFALDQLNGFYITGSDCGKALIKLNCRYFTLVFARVILDTTKARPHVTEDYNNVLEQIKNFCACDRTRCPIDASTLDSILGNTNSSTRAKYRGSGGCYNCDCNTGLYYRRGVVGNVGFDGNI